MHFWVSRVSGRCVCVPVCADGLACQVAPDPFVITVYARALF